MFDREKMNCRLIVCEIPLPTNSPSVVSYFYQLTLDGIVGLWYSGGETSALDRERPTGIMGMDPELQPFFMKKPLVFNTTNM